MQRKSQAQSGEDRVTTMRVITVSVAGLELLTDSRFISGFISIR
jgi:hypothetical protein